jgi:hypothetical protein
MCLANNLLLANAASRRTALEAENRISHLRCAVRHKPCHWNQTQNFLQYKTSWITEHILQPLKNIRPVYF